MSVDEQEFEGYKDILIGIANSKVELYEYRYRIKWYKRIVSCFWVGVIIGIIVYIVVLPFCPSFLQLILYNLSGYIIAFIVISGIIMIFPYIHQFLAGDDIIIGYNAQIRAAKINIAKLEHAGVLYDEYNLEGLSPQEHRMHKIPNLIATYRKQADGYRGWFILTQIIVIILSAAITSLSGGWLDRYVLIPWVVPVFSAFISILTSMTLFFKFRERGTNLQQTADAMDLEYQACDLGIKDYKGKSKEEALVLLVERVEDLRKEQQQRQQQLEQSSQTEDKALQSGG